MDLQKLLDAFSRAFEGKPYLHRNSTIGNAISLYLYEDLLTLARSVKFVQRVNSAAIVVNTYNRVAGRAGRRGDGTLGVLAPTSAPKVEPGFQVRRGTVAALEIGAEMKIMATKMSGQIDRVCGDLEKQAKVFRIQSPRAIAVGIVGVNFAEVYTGFEGDRRHDAKSPPAREAVEMIRRLDEPRPHFDELLILRYKATNRPPYAFRWVNEAQTGLKYGSALVRISDEYDQRF
jgi:hypothetical protein